MRQQVSVLIVFCFVFSSNGAAQFYLNFQQSTNKVIVTDFYYKLEYSIVRGKEEKEQSQNIWRKFVIKLQMIRKFNQYLLELDWVGI